MFAERRFVFVRPPDKLDVTKMRFGLEGINTAQAEKSLIKTLADEISATKTAPALAKLFGRFQKQWKKDFLKVGYDLNKGEKLINFDEAKFNSMHALLDRVLLSLSKKMASKKKQIEALKAKIEKVPNHSIVIETVDDNSKLPKKGVHYLSLKSSDFSEYAKSRIADLHNNPLIKGWLDEINKRDTLLIIGEAPNTKVFNAWNYYDIAAPINIADIKYDAPIQKFLRAKYPGKKVPGVIYSDHPQALSLVTVANEIYERYMAVMIEKKFGKKFLHFEEHAAVQVANLAIDKVLIERTMSKNINWHALAAELNRTMSFDEGHPVLKMYVDADDDVLKGDENKVLADSKPLQKEIARLLLKKISDVTGKSSSNTGLKIEFRKVKVENYKGDSEEEIPMPFFIVKNDLY